MLTFVEGLMSQWETLNDVCFLLTDINLCLLHL